MCRRPPSIIAIALVGLAGCGGSTYRPGPKVAADLHALLRYYHSSAQIGVVVCDHQHGFEYQCTVTLPTSQSWAPAVTDDGRSIVEKGIPIAGLGTEAVDIVR